MILYKKETEKIELVARPVENWRPRVGWVMGAIKSAPPETAHRGSWGRNTAIDRSMSAWDFFTWNTKRKGIQSDPVLWPKVIIFGALW